MQYDNDRIFCKSTLRYEQPTSVSEKNKPNPPAALKPLSIFVSIKDLHVGQSDGTSLFRRPPDVVLVALGVVTVVAIVVATVELSAGTFLHRGTFFMQPTLSHSGNFS